MVPVYSTRVSRYVGVRHSAGVQTRKSRTVLPIFLLCFMPNLHNLNINVYMFVCCVIYCFDVIFVTQRNTFFFTNFEFFAGSTFY